MAHRGMAPPTRGLRCGAFVSDRAEPAVISLGRGRFTLVDGLRRRTGYAVGNGGDTWVYFDGRVHVVNTEPAGRPARKGRHHGALDDDAALSAPMPATVVAVNVGVGQQVVRGDLLVTLEAMKMELAVRAPRDGTIRKIGCRPGELVQPGVPLVELE